MSPRQRRTALLLAVAVIVVAGFLALFGTASEEQTYEVPIEREKYGR